MTSESAHKQIQGEGTAHTHRDVVKHNVDF